MPTQAEKDFWFANFHQMPDAWYPDQFYFYGKHGNEYELGCTVPLKNGTIDANNLLNSMKALRQALWLKIETDRIHRIFLATRTDY